MITGETLMAYADGELADEDRALVEKALLENGQAQEALAEEWRLRRSLLALYDPMLNEEVPERLRRLVELEPAGAALAPKRDQQIRRSWWHNVTAIAATLVLGIFLGHVIATDRAPTDSDSVSVATGELNRALDVQLASAQSPVAPIQIGISFVGPEGNPCRSFRSQNLVGLACRDDGRWALRLVAPFERSATFEYQQAGSATALIMGSAQELMAGEPMNAAEERSARDSGWAARRD